MKTFSVNEISKTEAENVKSAWRLLAGLCDGANRRDDLGFAKAELIVLNPGFDNFQVLNRLDKLSWKEALTLYKSLVFHQRQLVEAGFDRDWLYSQKLAFDRYTHNKTFCQFCKKGTCRL